MRAALHLLIVLCLSSGPAWGHGHDGPSREGLAKFFEAILKAIAGLQAPPPPEGTKRPYFYYGGRPGEKIHVNGSALEQILFESLELYRDGLAQECPGCGTESEHEAAEKAQRTWIARKIKAAGDTGIEISGTAYEYFKQHGLGFAAWFFVFESFEHFVLDALFPPLYAIPMCPIGMALYGATVGTLKDFLRLGSNPFGGAGAGRRYWTALAFHYHRWKFTRRAKWIFLENPLGLLRAKDFRKKLLDEADQIERRLAKTCFWGEVYGTFLKRQATEAGVFSDLNLRSDIEFIFARNSGAARWERMFRHTEGLYLMKDLLSEWIQEAREDGKLSIPAYFRAKGVVGRLGHLLKEYRHALAAVAGTPGNIPDAEKKINHLHWLLVQILEVFEEGKKLSEGDHFTSKFLTLRLQALTREHSEFKENLRPTVWGTCKRVLSQTWSG